MATEDMFSKILGVLVAVAFITIIVGSIVFWVFFFAQGTKAELQSLLQLMMWWFGPVLVIAIFGWIERIGLSEEGKLKWERETDGRAGVMTLWFIGFPLCYLWLTGSW